MEVQNVPRGAQIKVPTVLVPCRWSGASLSSFCRPFVFFGIWLLISHSDISSLCLVSNFCSSPTLVRFTSKRKSLVTLGAPGQAKIVSQVQDP